MNLFAFGLGQNTGNEFIFFYFTLIAILAAAFFLSFWMLYDLVVNDRGFTRKEKKFWFFSLLAMWVIFYAIGPFILAIIYARSIRKYKDKQVKPAVINSVAPQTIEPVQPNTGQDPSN